MLNIPIHEKNTQTKTVSKESLSTSFPYYGSSQNRDWGHDILDIKKCWDEFNLRGDGVKVAVLDTGIDGIHEDLKVSKGVDLTGSVVNWQDVQSHGTHCAGIIGAKDNQTGIVGVAPNCELFAVKVLSDNGSGTIDVIAKGVDWAVNNGADVISMSLGGDGPVHPLMQNSLDRAIAAGCLVIVAAGNSGPYPDTIGAPGKYTPCITVGAIDSNTDVANFSSRGVAIDIVAPGVDILSTVPGNRYTKMSGTSMATPYVAGIAALYVQLMKQSAQKPNQKHFEMLAKSTAQDLGNLGIDNDYGAGLICPVKIFAKILGDGVPPKPVPKPVPKPDPKPDQEPEQKQLPTVTVLLENGEYKSFRVKSYTVSFV